MDEQDIYCGPHLKIQVQSGYYIVNYLLADMNVYDGISGRMDIHGDIFSCQKRCF